jgi:spermidine synthase
VALAQSQAPFGGLLELMLHGNQLVLVTDGVLHSDGKRYLPAMVVADLLADELPSMRTMLVLGGGLGSIVRVMRSRGLHPRYTLIEQDRTVLGWAMETLVDQRHHEELEPVCQDAEAFMAENQRRFDLVFVDVFKGRKVPWFVTTPGFLRRCRDSLAPGGRLAFNYLVEDEHRWERVRRIFADVFPEARVVKSYDNRILFNHRTR